MSQTDSLSKISMPYAPYIPSHEVKPEILPKALEHVGTRWTGRVDVVST